MPKKTGDQPSKKPSKPRKAAPKKAKKGKSAQTTVPLKEKKLLKDVLSTQDPITNFRHAAEIMQECMGSYILLGYTFDGQPITAVVANTPQEYDALYSRVASFLQMRPPGSPMPGPPPSHQEPE